MKTLNRDLVVIALITLFGGVFFIPLGLNLGFRASYSENHPQENVFGESEMLDSIGSDVLQYYQDYYDPWGALLIPSRNSLSNSSVVPGLHNFRYIYALLSSENESNRLRADQILQRIFLVEQANNGSSFAQSLYNGYLGYGSFHSYYPRNWGDEHRYVPIDPEIIIDYIPYLAAIIDDFSADISQRSQQAVISRLRLMADALIRNQPDPGDLEQGVKWIAASVSLNKIVQSWFLEQKTLRYSQQLIGVYLSNSLTVSCSQQLTGKLVVAFGLIERYAPVTYRSLYQALYSHFVGPMVIECPTESNISLNITGKSAAIDSYFLLANNLTEIVHYYEDLGDFPDLSTFRIPFFIRIAPIFLGVLLLAIVGGILFMAGRFPKKPEVDSDETQTNRWGTNWRPDIQPSQVIAVIPVIFAVLATIFVMGWHFKATFYLILVLWPLVFIYGLSRNPKIQKIGIGLYLGYLALFISGMIGFGSILLTATYTAIWVMESIHTGWIMCRTFLRKQIGSGRVLWRMGLVLLYVLTVEIIYLVTFIGNDFWVNLPNYLSMAIFFKATILIRTEYS